MKILKNLLRLIVSTIISVFIFGVAIVAWVLNCFGFSAPLEKLGEFLSMVIKESDEIRKSGGAK